MAQSESFIPYPIQLVHLLDLRVSVHYLVLQVFWHFDFFLPSLRSHWSRHAHSENTFDHRLRSSHLTDASPSSQRGQFRQSPQAEFVVTAASRHTDRSLLDGRQESRQACNSQILKLNSLYIFTAHLHFQWYLIRSSLFLFVLLPHQHLQALFLQFPFV